MSSHSLSWFQNTFADLQTDLLVSTKLKELKVALTGLQSSQISTLARSLPLKILFDCLNSLDKKQYEVELARALRHPEKCVKETVLHELCRLESERDIEGLICRRPAFISDILHLLLDEDLSVAQVAIDLLSKIGKTEYGFKAMISQNVEEFLKVLNDSEAVHSLRIYQVMLEIGVKSEEKLQKLESAGLLRGFGSLLTSDDILAKMAAIEELSKLVSTAHGYRFLSRQNCILLLAKELSEAPESPLSSILTPGLLKFFGCTCRLHAAEIHKDYPQVLERVVTLVDSEDLVIAVTAIEAVGFICSTSQGKLLLVMSGEDCMGKVLKRMEELIVTGQVDWKHRALYALANLLNVEELDRKSVELTEEWFSQFGASTGLNILTTMTRNPFPEVKLAAFHVFLKLAKLPWAQRAISASPGMLDYLLDRSTETELQALVAKFDIVSELADSSTSTQVFTDSEYSRIRDYHKQGATCPPNKLFVAVEGAE